MVQKFAVSKFDWKYCVRYHVTLLPVVNHLKTARTAKLASLKGKKKKKNSESNFQKCFLWDTANSVRWIASQICLCLWCVSPSRLLTTLFGQLVRQEDLWVVRAGMMPTCLMCDYVSVTPLPPPTCTHTTQCAIMLLALCGDPQYTCVTGPVWDCLLFFHIKRPLKEAPAAKSTSSLCDHQCFNQSGGLENPRPRSAFCSFDIL